MTGALQDSAEGQSESLQDVTDTVLAPRADLGVHALSPGSDVLALIPGSLYVVKNKLGS